MIETAIAGAGRTRTSNQTIISSWLAKCPEWRGCVYERLVSAKSRLNFNETVSAPLSLLQKFRFLAGDHYRRGLY